MMDPYDPLLNANMMAAVSEFASMSPEERSALIDSSAAAQNETPVSRQFEVVFTILIFATFAFPLLFWLGAVTWPFFNPLASFIIANRLETAAYTLFAITLLIFATGLYRLRCRYRLAYGLLEIGFGILSIFSAAAGLLDSLIGRNSTELLNTQTAISLAAGLYILVRGLANIEDGIGVNKGWGSQTRSQRLWGRVFYSPLFPGKIQSQTPAN